MCEILTQEISKLDPANRAVYEKNAQLYIEKLEELDDKFEKAIKNSTQRTLVFADRFPFLYLMSDYGIKYYAAFQGCSAETEASFETVSFLTKKVNENDVNYVMIIDNGLEKLASTIINNSQRKDAQILTLNSIQSITKEDIKNGKAYLSIMEDNLKVLEKALQ